MSTVSNTGIMKLSRKKSYDPNRMNPSAVVILNVVFLLGVIVCVAPVLLIVAVSFTSEANILKYGYNLFPVGYSLDTYRFLFKDPSVVYNAYGVTIFTTVVATVFCLINVALFAYPISRKDFKFQNEVTFFMFFTMLFGGGLVSYYIVMTGVFGLRNSIFAIILPYCFNAFWVIVMRTFYKNQIPESLIESARIDGAGRWQAFRHVTFPLLGPTLRVSVFLSMVGALQLFDMIWVMTKGGPIGASNTMATLMFKNGFQSQLMGYGSALAVILFGFALVLALAYQRYVLRRDVEGALTAFNG